MGDKSGIDMLEEILRRLAIIEKKIDVQDQNIKKIANTARIAELVNKASGTPVEDWARANKIEKARAQVVDAKAEIERIKSQVKGKTRFKFDPQDAAKTQAPSAMAHKRKGAGPTTIMCKGKMLIDNKGDLVPLPGLDVKIYNSEDKLVKETKTNRAGHWMSQLSPGHYVVLYEGEYNGSKLTSVNKNFEVPKELPEGQKFIEVV